MDKIKALIELGNVNEIKSTLFFTINSRNNGIITLITLSIWKHSTCSVRYVYCADRIISLISSYRKQILLKTTKYGCFVSDHL